MKLVVFGLTISSAWGNGHATLWRGLCRALGERGHDVVFFERDVPYYAAHRDQPEPPGCRVQLYADWQTVRPCAEREVAEADVAMLTSYCPDAWSAAAVILNSDAVRVFYDLDTGVTLNRIRRGEPVAYLPPGGLSDFDLVLSYTGGTALDDLRRVLGARRVAPLYGSVDPQAHRAVAPRSDLTSDLSYLGTYAPDRQSRLEQLFIEPARRSPSRKFIIGGSQYPCDFPWAPNIYYVRHMPPPDHPEFYCSSALTLNVTRGAMAETGYCPSGRLFEAAACGTPVLSDHFDGLESFFEPGCEILVAHSTEDALDALQLSRAELARIGCAARDRALAEHTASHRVGELERLLELSEAA